MLLLQYWDKIQVRRYTGHCLKLYFMDFFRCCCACAIIAWAHLLLGLHVSVETDNVNEREPYLFPRDQATTHVFIKCYQNRGHTAKTSLFSAEAFTWFRHTNAFLATSRSNERILDTVKLLFEASASEFKVKTAYEYAALYSNRNFNTSEPPTNIATLLKKWQEISHEGDWEELRDATTLICAILLAFAHVTDLQECAYLRLSGIALNFSRSKFLSSLKNWDGRSIINVESHTWLEIIALMMIDETDLDLNLDNVALVSHGGWAVYVNTFGAADSFYLDHGCLNIQRGVPWRLGVTKHRIMDGAHTKYGHVGIFVDLGITQKSGDVATLQCICAQKFLRSQIGDSEDSFLITLRIKRVDEKHEGIRRTGFRALWDSQFMARKIKKCHHTIQEQMTSTLEPRWTTCAGVEPHVFEPDGDLTICLTANNKEARWSALLEGFPVVCTDPRPARQMRTFISTLKN
ncbi:hypothetical protein EJ08DRAFT_256800 [Tothia fuscella]|uniref:Uncharacterized protein n=1 Tax=Tothia fuscella TaxID=1048955 RepID=A0A9P4TXT6_9PEZI|nr:hypothetical protein EJ08DRAFT_256800 [Tothia fuscella]